MFALTENMKEVHRTPQILDNDPSKVVPEENGKLRTSVIIFQVDPFVDKRLI